jgi:hypothetical protein
MMTRVPQQKGVRGSLKWIQGAVNDRWQSLEEPILANLQSAGSIEWVSPRESDDFAEYRDGAFLEVLGHSDLSAALKQFWPAGGPQWDALGRTDQGDILLVEAKAHVGEMCSPPTAASNFSRERIRQRLDEVALRLGARAMRAPWTDFFYQLGNRIAHLEFLRGQGVRAHLVLVNFLNDSDMGGPATPEAWRVAYQVAFHVMGIPKRHALSPFILDVYPDVRGVNGVPTPHRVRQA